VVSAQTPHPWEFGMEMSLEFDNLPTRATSVFHFGASQAATQTEARDSSLDTRNCRT
jgi:hypothetical protein